VSSGNWLSDEIAVQLRRGERGGAPDQDQTAPTRERLNTRAQLGFDACSRLTERRGLSEARTSSGSENRTVRGRCDHGWTEGGGYPGG